MGLKPRAARPMARPMMVASARGALNTRLRAELALQAVGGLEHPALALHLVQDLRPGGVGHVLAEQQDGRVAGHLLAQGGVDQVDHGLPARGRGLRSALGVEGGAGGVHRLAVEVAAGAAAVRGRAHLGFRPGQVHLALDLRLQLLEPGLAEVAQLHQPGGVGDHRVDAGLLGPLGGGLVELLVVGKGVRVGPGHPGPHQGRALAGAGIGHRFGHGFVAGQRVEPVHRVEHQQAVRLPALEQGRHVGAGVLHLGGHRNGVAVVLHQEHQRHLEVHGAVDALPEFPFGRRAVAEGHQDHFVPLDAQPLLQAVALGPQDGLRRAHRLQALGAGGAGGGEDVDLRVRPVAGHLPAAGGGVELGAHRGQEHVPGGHAQPVGQGPVAVVQEEPVLAGPQAERRRRLHRLVADAVDLEEHLVLALAGDLPVVDAARGVDGAKERDPLAGGQGPVFKANGRLCQRASFHRGAAAK